MAGRIGGMIRKVAGLLLLSVVLSLMLPLAALANSPAPPRCFYIKAENMPEEAAGFDLMLPVDEMEETSRSGMNTDTLAQAGLSDRCELARYNDGFVSYLAHFEGADYYQRGYAGSDYATVGYTSRLDRMSALRIAVYDEEGRILALSDPFRLEKNAKWRFSGTIDYDVLTGVAEPDFYSSSGWIIGLIIVGPLTCLIAMVLTIVVEVITGLFFGMRPLRTVALTTGISNVIMNVWLILLHYVYELPWLPVVAVLEILVLAAEYSVYKNRFTQHTPKRIAVYTLVANAASFAFVMLMLAVWSV